MRTYLITGSASGIGKATGARLEAAGGRVIGLDLSDAEVCLDLADPVARASLGERLAALGCERLDGVLAGAGVGGANATPELVVRLNFFGAVSTVTQTLPLLRRSAAPRVCMIASVGMMLVDDAESDIYFANDEEGAVAAFAGRSGGEAYAAGKRAISYWVRRNAVSEDWIASRILLNVVAPGFIATGMTKHITHDAAVTNARLKDLGQPLGLGEPDDVASIVAYLLSADNTLITGQTIYVDGGHEALRGQRSFHSHDASLALQRLAEQQKGKQA